MKSTNVWQVILWVGVVVFVVYNTAEHGFRDTLTGALVYIGGAFAVTLGLAVWNRWRYKRMQKEESDGSQDQETPGKSGDEVTRS